MQHEAPEDIAIHRLEWDIPIYIWQLNEYNFLKFAQVKRPFYDHLRGRDLGRLIKTRYFTVELIVEGNEKRLRLPFVAFVVKINGLIRWDFEISRKFPRFRRLPYYRE